MGRRIVGRARCHGGGCADYDGGGDHPVSTHGILAACIGDTGRSKYSRQAAIPLFVCHNFPSHRHILKYSGRDRRETHTDAWISFQ